MKLENIIKSVVDTRTQDILWNNIESIMYRRTWNNVSFDLFKLTPINEVQSTFVTIISQSSIIETVKEMNNHE